MLQLYIYLVLLRPKRINYKRLDKLFRSITDAGGTPLFVIFPASAQVSERYWVREDYDRHVLDARPISELTSWMTEMNIPFLNLLPIFRKSEKYPLYIDSFHLSPIGNHVAATAIYNSLDNSKLLNEL